MGADEVLELIGKLVVAQTGKPLNDLQRGFIKRLWQQPRLDYDEIADQTGYSHAYVKEVACQLWQVLSKALGEKVSKTNFRSLIEEYARSQSSNSTISSPPEPEDSQQAEILEADCSTLECSPEEVTEVTPEQGKGQLPPLFALDDFWVGRTDLLRQLKKRLQSSCRVLVLAGITGIGKTALAENLIMDFQPLLNLCRINLDYYGESTEFASIAAYLLEAWKQPVSEDDRREPKRLLNWVVSYLQQNACLLVIDSLENVLKGNENTGWSEFNDPLWEQFFTKLLSAEVCASKVLLTSQDFPAQIKGNRNLYECYTLGGLTGEEQLNLFHQMGLQVENSEFGGYLEQIGRVYEGHPLALRVIAGEILESPFDGNVQIYWKQYGHEFDRAEQLRHQSDLECHDDSLRLAQYSRVLRRLVKERIERTLQRLSSEVPLSYVLLCLGAVYRRPVPEQFWMRALEGRSLDEDQQSAVLDALYDRYLVERVVIDGDLMIRQHNLIRSTALEHLKKLRP